MTELICERLTSRAFDIEHHRIVKEKSCSIVARLLRLLSNEHVIR